MRIRIEVCPDRRLFAAAESHVLATKRAGRRLLALGPVVVGTMLLVVGEGAWLFGSLLIAIGLAEATLLPWLQVRLGGRGRARGHPRLVELHDGGVHCVGGTYDLEWPWAMVERIVELPGQYLLMRGPRHYVCVPTGGLSDGELADLRALLRTRAVTVT